MSEIGALLTNMTYLLLDYNLVLIILKSFNEKNDQPWRMTIEIIAGHYHLLTIVDGTNLRPKIHYPTNKCN